MALMICVNVAILRFTSASEVAGRFDGSRTHLLLNNETHRYVLFTLILYVNLNRNPMIFIS